MADAGVNIASLTEDQQLALQQYTSVTDQDIAAAIPLLRNCQWNAQIAITRFFDGDTDIVDVAAEAARQPPPPTQRQAQNLQDSFSTNGFARYPAGMQPAPRVVPLPESQMIQQLPVLLQIVFLPFRITYGIFQRLYSTIGWAFPILPRLIDRFLTLYTGRSGRYASRKPLNPRDNAARFIREFEEDYGVSSGTLPFQETGYAQAFDKAKKELKFLVVVLLSPEHDDTTSFVQDTLLAPEFTEFVKSKPDELLIWAGSVRDSEAYQVADALHVTKFPFVGLIVHTPSVSSTAMSTVARVPGPTPPAELIEKLRRAIDTRTEELRSARAAQREQAAARSIRDEQNSAYERSLAIDRERARARREEQAAQERAEREEKQRAEEAENKARNILRWRQWRARRLEPEPGSDVQETSRVSLRLSSGERVIRKFRGDAEIEELYAFVECYGIEQEEEDVDKPDGFKHEYAFRLVSPVPREVYDLEKAGTIKQRIGRSGNLIVEKILDEDQDDES